MQRRKIQLIAGSTYTLSLPKNWVEKNNLKPKDEIMITEKNDGTLLLSAQLSEKKELNDISLEIDNYIDIIDRVIFSIYYLGIENITLYSKKSLSKETRAKIRKTLTYMSGTEITYEDTEKIVIKVLLDKSKVDMPQILYRQFILLESSLSNLVDGIDKYESRINENEIDRLYQLTSKIIHLSLSNPNILNSSKIKNISLIPSYFLISKRLENIGDNVYNLSKYLLKENKNLKDRKHVIEFIRKELGKGIKHLVSQEEFFRKFDETELKRTYSLVSEIKDKTVENFLKDTIRYLVDIEEEILNIFFCNKLIKENLL